MPRAEKEKLLNSFSFIEFLHIKVTNKKHNQALLGDFIIIYLTNFVHTECCLLLKYKKSL